MTEIEIIAKAMDTCRKRWSIEEVHRQMKQSMKWESMRLASYQGMKNLNAFMALALYFTYKCKDYIHILAVGFPKLLQYVKKDWAKPRQGRQFKTLGCLPKMTKPRQGRNKP